MASQPLESSAYVQPKAAWRVTLGAEDLTARLAPLLVSLRLSEKDGEEADQLELVLDDSAGKVAIPPEGATLQVWLGWERGTEVTTGLVFKGSFKVDEAGYSSPPDRITITARSADLAESFRTRRNRTFSDGTLGDVVGVIAQEHGLEPRCHPDLAEKPIVVAEQAGKSDMQFLRDLGRRYDASAVVKAGTLIFAPKGAPTTASGSAMPEAVLVRSRCSSIDWKRAARDKAQDGAEAQWHDRHEAKRKTHSTGGTNPKRLKRMYATEGDARAAAEAETRRLKRAAATLSASLAWGNPLLCPGMRITPTGFKPEIDGTQWLISSAEHVMDASGLRTQLEMEVAV
ncbi:MAG: contractile injection system protein, VgrG/Pvc8 family [Novosphingobium sp.]